MRNQGAWGRVGAGLLLCWWRQLKERMYGTGRGEEKRQTFTSGQRQKEAIAAALEAFSQFGIHGTRLEQVAERAGVSKTNLLYYYPSKEALYVAVLQQILAIWLAPLKAFREDISPLVAIREYIRLKLEVSRDHPVPRSSSASRCCRGAAADGRTDRGSESAGRRKIGDSLRLDRPRQAGAGRSTAFNLYDLGYHPALRRLRHPWRRSPAPRCRMRPFEQTVDNVQRMIIEGIRVR